MSKVVKSHSRTSKKGKKFKVRSFSKKKGKNSGLRMSDSVIQKINVAKSGKTNC